MFVSTCSILFWSMVISVNGAPTGGEQGTSAAMKDRVRRQADTIPDYDYVEYGDCDDYYWLPHCETKELSNNHVHTGEPIDPDLFEGDIIEDDADYSDYYGSDYYFEFVTSDRKWPKQGKNVYVQYEVDHMTPHVRKQIEWVEDQFKSETCIRLVERKKANEPSSNYIRLDASPRGRCASEIGMKGGEQRLLHDPNECSKGNLLHEFMHALGTWHEHTRTDREDYIDIDWVALYKIQEEKGARNLVNNFKRCDRADRPCAPSDTPYDFDSIMHYSAALPIAPTTTLITPLPHHGIQTIGQRDHLSKYDVEGLRKLYDCGHARSSTGPQGSKTRCEQYGRTWSCQEEQGPRTCCIATAKPPTTSEGYVLIENRECIRDRSPNHFIKEDGPRYPKFATKEEALEACSNNTSCKAVTAESCDNPTEISLCYTSDSIFTSRTGTCIYIKEKEPSVNAEKILRRIYEEHNEERNRTGVPNLEGIDQQLEQIAATVGCTCDQEYSYAHSDASYAHKERCNQFTTNPDECFENTAWGQYGANDPDDNKCRTINGKRALIGNQMAESQDCWTKSPLKNWIKEGRGGVHYDAAFVTSSFVGCAYNYNCAENCKGEFNILCMYRTANKEGCLPQCWEDYFCSINPFCSPTCDVGGC